jgi:hypothetical protein
MSTSILKSTMYPEPTDSSSFVIEVKASEIVPAGAYSYLRLLIPSVKLRLRLYTSLPKMQIHPLGCSKPGSSGADR